MYLTKQETALGVEQIYSILQNVGVIFEDSAIVEQLVSYGAKADGFKVYFTQEMIDTALSRFDHFELTESNDKKIIAANPFGNAPTLLDNGNFRRPLLKDVVKLYQLTETSPLYQYSNPGLVDPEDNDAEDLYLSQVALMLKYCDRPVNLGIRASKGQSPHGDVYSEAKKTLRLLKDFTGQYAPNSFSQPLCPFSPLTYDEECLDNMKALIEEKQGICFCPCTLTYMTGPETVWGTAIHDAALSLAGVIYVMYTDPEIEVSVSACSAVTDLRTMQPCYGAADTTRLCVMVYELCLALGIYCSLSVSNSDAVAVDYQMGSEAAVTALLPFLLTDIPEVWTYPGIMAGYSCASFDKMILDEDAVRNLEHALTQKMTVPTDQLEKELTEAFQYKNFLLLGNVADYEADHYLPQIMDHRGVVKANAEKQHYLKEQIEKTIRERTESYTAPYRSEDQKKLINDLLPSSERFS